MHSNGSLQIDGTLLAPPRVGSWPKSSWFQWLNFKWVHNFTIRGTGTIDGQGSDWWRWSLSDRAYNIQVLCTYGHVHHHASMVFSFFFFFAPKVSGLIGISGLQKKMEHVPDMKPTVRRSLTLGLECRRNHANRGLMYFSSIHDRP